MNGNPNLTSALLDEQGFIQLNTEIKGRPSRRTEGRGITETRVEFESDCSLTPTINVGLGIGSDQSVRDYLSRLLFARFCSDHTLVETAFGSDALPLAPSRVVFEEAGGHRRIDRIQVFATRSDGDRLFLSVYGLYLEAWLVCIESALKEIGFEKPTEGLPCKRAA